MSEMQQQIEEIAKKVLPIPIQRFLYRVVRGETRKLVSKPERDLEAIFIHVPKNAGVSISKGLFGIRVGHRRFRDLYFHEPELIQRFFVFAFVRNPWDRFLSTYKFLEQGGFNETDKKWAEENLSAWDNFEDFVLALENGDNSEHILAEKHFRPQAYWLLDHQGKIKLDYAGRYENLDEDFEYICTRLGVNCSLPHLNKSDHSPYYNYYNERTKRIVGNLYRQDIRLLNYTFHT
jgi:hypothetical protein